MAFAFGGLAMGTFALVIVIGLVPLLSVLIEWIGDSGISERHHSHHDTYLVPRSISSTLMLMMTFVGVLGLVAGWLCSVGVFTADAISVYTFFASFLVVAFIMWLGIRRYRVTTFADSLNVTPFFGSTKKIRYDEIQRMRWLRSYLGSGYRSLLIYGQSTHAFLWGTLDLEQILSRINRFDVMSHNETDLKI